MLSGNLLSLAAPAALALRCHFPSLHRLVLKRGRAWSVEKEPHTLPPASRILQPERIRDLLEATKNPSLSAVQDVLQVALDHALLKHEASPDSGEFVQGLTDEQTAILLNADSKDEELMNAIFGTARKVKEAIYGSRIVLFAPLYLANYCVNSCTYCAFRSANKDMVRSMLTDEQIAAEAKSLQQMGHKRLLLLTGEHPAYTFDDFLRAMDIVSKTRTDPCGVIRRINVEIPALSVSDMRRLKATNQVGTYTLFQETYCEETFNKVHPRGPKSDFQHRLQTMDRAQIAGVDDVGIGALFGLHDYRFEVMSLLQHARYLDETYKAGPHTISIPRLQPALGAVDSVHQPAPVSDPDFLKLTAIIRCAVPYTGMILSTRESAELRRKLIHLGISQISAGSRTDVGKYSADSGTPSLKSDHVGQKDGAAGQFSLQDLRSLDAVVKDLLDDGFMPSFCTACYRKGRTGEAFMKIAKTGRIQDFCSSNSLLTLSEYLLDYAMPNTREAGLQAIRKEMESDHISEGQKKLLDRKMARVVEGERDLYF
jgi:2-iminoacetate synthase